MEVRIAQAVLRDAIHGRGRDDAAERAWCTETLVIRHDEQHVGRALGRHNARWPPGLRLGRLFLDDPAECRIGRRELFSVNRGGRTGRTGLTCRLLRYCRGSAGDEGGNGGEYQMKMFQAHWLLPELRHANHWWRKRRSRRSLTPKILV